MSRWRRITCVPVSLCAVKKRAVIGAAIMFVVLATRPIAECAVADDDAWLAGRPQPWTRRERPILSALTTKQAWAKVTLYSPHVIRMNGVYKMWYVGNASATRRPDLVIGYATSRDGIDWTPYKQNPILTLKDLPWGSFWQTPCVRYDADERVYKMWFTSLSDTKTNDEGRLISGVQQLGYATSDDGIRWKIRARPIFPYGRSPCVIKEGAGKYRMWMNSGPLKDGKHSGLFRYIYEFASTDGIRWKQAPRPAIAPSGLIRTVVYPYVVRRGERYFMWYGGHVAGGRFELFCAESADGSTWKTDHQRPAFPAATDKNRFDGRYTSTPCVVPESDRMLLFYSARDLSNEYLDGEGKTRRDGAGVYQHIGVATHP